MRTRTLLTATAAAVLVLSACSSSTEPTPEPESEATATAAPEATPVESQLAEQVEAAFSESYGWPEDPFWSAIEGFDDRDAPRVTVVTSLFPKAENDEQAMGLCRAVSTVTVDEEFTGVYVVAGEDGPQLARCDVAGA